MYIVHVYTNAQTHMHKAYISQFDYLKVLSIHHVSHKRCTGMILIHL